MPVAYNPGTARASKIIQARQFLVAHMTSAGRIKVHKELLFLLPAMSGTARQNISSGQKTVRRPEYKMRLFLDRFRIDDEAKADVAGKCTHVGVVDLGGGDYFYVSEYLFLSAVIEHLLGFLDAADERAGQRLSAHDERRRRHFKRLG